MALYSLLGSFMDGSASIMSWMCGFELAPQFKPAIPLNVPVRFLGPALEYCGLLMPALSSSMSPSQNVRRSLHASIASDLPCFTLHVNRSCKASMSEFAQTPNGSLSSELHPPPPPPPTPACRECTIHMTKMCTTLPQIMCLWQYVSSLSSSSLEDFPSR